MNEVTINQTPLSVKEYEGKRVVTFKDIDAVHGRPDGTARKRFNENKKRFIAGLDLVNAPNWAFDDIVLVLQPREEARQDTANVIHSDLAGLLFCLIEIVQFLTEFLAPVEKFQVRTFAVIHHGNGFYVLAAQYLQTLLHLNVRKNQLLPTFIRSQPACERGKLLSKLL